MERTPPVELAIAPARVLCGPHILDRLGDFVSGPTLVVGGPKTLPRFRERLAISATWGTYDPDSSEESVRRLMGLLPAAGTVVGIGGGKALDTAKMVAHRLGVPCVTVPTSPATCAAWSALSNLYSVDGTWLETVIHAPPAAMLLDYDLVGRVPPRLLASGIADALAKWYEGRSAKDQDLLTKSALGIAQQLRDTLFEIGLEAVARVGDPADQTVQDAIDATIRLPGLVGGIGGEKCRSVAAHAVANAITAFPGHRASLHGEKVGFGILVQLILEGAPPAEVWEVARFFERLAIPMTLSELGIRASAEEVATRCVETQSGLRHLPVRVSPVLLAGAIRAAESLLARV